MRPGPGADHPDRTAAADAPLTDDEKALCRAMGITEDAYKASRKQDLERTAA